MNERYKVRQRYKLKEIEKEIEKVRNRERKKLN